MKVEHHLSFAALVAALAALVACGGGAGHTDSADTAVAPPPEPAAPAVWRKDGLTVTSVPGSPEFPGATLKLEGIRNGESLEAGAVAFAFGVEGYELGVPTADAAGKEIADSDQGQHIHLILNNGPYSAHYEATFTQELEAGDYVMLAFLSRSYHESLKNPKAAVVRHFTVGGAAARKIDLEAPHLFYSRPKGSYSGNDTAKILLDFYLLNTTLSADGHRVRATINGTAFVFTEWVPYLVEGLPLGETEIRLELLDAAGNPVPGPFNSVRRTFTLEGIDEENAA